MNVTRKRSFILYFIIAAFIGCLGFFYSNILQVLLRGQRILSINLQQHRQAAILPGVFMIATGYCLPTAKMGSAFIIVTKKFGAVCCMQ